MCGTSEILIHGTIDFYDEGDPQESTCTNPSESHTIVLKYGSACYMFLVSLIVELSMWNHTCVHTQYLKPHIPHESPLLWQAADPGAWINAEPQKCRHRQSHDP